MIVSETEMPESRIGVNTYISVLGLALDAEDHGAMVAGFNNLQQIVGLLGQEETGRVFIQDQEIHRFVSDQTFLCRSTVVCYARLVQKSLRPDIA